MMAHLNVVYPGQVFHRSHLNSDILAPFFVVKGNCLAVLKLVERACTSSNVMERLEKG